MQIALVVIGAVILLVAVRDTWLDFGKTLKGDFTGPGNFGYRATAIILIGVIGYAGEDARKLSVALLILMVLGLLLSKDKDFFNKLQQGVAGRAIVPVANPAAGSSSGVQKASGTNALQQGMKLLQTYGPMVAAMFA